MLIIVHLYGAISIASGSRFIAGLKRWVLDQRFKSSKSSIGRNLMTGGRSFRTAGRHRGSLDQRRMIYGLVDVDELRRTKVVRDLVAVNEMVEIGWVGSSGGFEL